MREDDYTGTPIDDGDEIAELLADDVLSEFDAEYSESFGEDESEMIVDLRAAAEGAKSLREIAELLYDLADELLALSADGWEILDDITNGHGVAVRFDEEEPTSE